MKNVTNSGFTRVELIVLVGVITILAVFLLLPMVPHDHNDSHSIRCVNNLKEVALSELLDASDNESGKASWHISTNQGGSLEFHDSTEVWRHFRFLSNQVATPKVLHCPADKERQPADDWLILRNENVSYFVNVAATLTNGEPEASTILFGDRLIDPGQASRSTLARLPTNRPLAWTRNIHGKVGCIAFADGHVEQFTAENLNKLLTNGELYGTERTVPPALLAIP